MQYVVQDFNDATISLNTFPDYCKDFLFYEIGRAHV